MKGNYSKSIARCFFTFAVACLVLWPSFSVFASEESSRKAVPRIDDKAACVVRECEDDLAGVNNRISDKEENKYSQNFWMLLFGTYLFLLIFNLSFNFKKAKELQWFWEAVFTFLAIYVWDNLDVGRSNTWFPGAVLESGIIIYAFYFYFLSQKKIAKPEQVC